MPEKVDMHGVMIDNVTMNEALDKVLSMLKGQTPQKIFTPNSEIIMLATRETDLKHIQNRAELVEPDGAGVILASRMRKDEVKEKVS